MKGFVRIVNHNNNGTLQEKTNTKQTLIIYLVVRYFMLLFDDVAVVVFLGRTRLFPHELDGFLGQIVIVAI